MTLSEMLESNAESAAIPNNPNIMNAEEVAEARRCWAEENENCVDSMDEDLRLTTVPTEDIWLAYCQWCAYEFGTSILG